MLAPRPRRTLRTTLHSAWAAATVVLLAAYVAQLTFGDDGQLRRFFTDWVQCGLLVNGAVLCAVAARRRRRALPWWILTVGLAAWAVGNVLWTTHYQHLSEAPYPSWSDALWLAYYPAMYVALVLLVRDRVERFRASVWLDGLIGALGSAALAATLLWPTLLASGDATTATMLTNLAYPVADVLLLAVLAASLSLTGARLDRGLALMVVGMLLNTAADVIYLLRLAHGWSDGPSLLDPLWVAAQCFMAAAAWQRVPTRPARLEGWRLIVLPATFASAALGLLAWSAVRTMPAVPCLLAVGTIVAAALRAGLTYRENALLLEARREARTDDLTGLANRRELYARLDGLFGGDRGTHAVLLLDLDGFKELNDALGHQAGDELLQAVAGRLRDALPDAELLVRLGGDEFVVVLAPAGEADAIAAGEAVHEALAATFRLEDTDVHVQASVGVALAPAHGRTRTELLRHADVAMYRAKRGGTGLEVHDAGARVPDAGDLQLASDLHGAIAAGQLAVYFQPKVDLATGALAGAEALVRWLHPAHGLIAPDAFLPLAARHGLMRELTAAVLDGALTNQATWRAHGLDLPVAVNLAPANVVDTALAASVASALERHRAPADRLTLEITEDTVMVDAGRTLDVLHALRDVGVQLALDDFGTGHSSLSYLKRLPIDELKIDKSFVQHMTVDTGDEAIVEAAIALARRFGIRVVAEGVEDLGTCERLRALDCDEMQGFFIARPLPGDQFLAFALDECTLGSPDAGAVTPRDMRPLHIGG